MNRPPFEQYPVLESTRLRLEELNASHAGFVLDILFYNGKPAEDISEGQAMIARIAGDYDRGNTVNWVLVSRETGKPMGTIGYYRGFAAKTGEIGFVMKPEFHGKGYMTEALELVIRFGLDVLQLERIIAVTKPSNAPAIRLLERCGFRFVAPFDDVYSEYAYTGEA